MCICPSTTVFWQNTKGFPLTVLVENKVVQVLWKATWQDPSMLYTQGSLTHKFHHGEFILQIAVHVQDENTQDCALQH